jgi:putative hydrolase of the HAD superfamily
MTAIEAVTFDYWNTLVYEDRGQLRGHRLEAWAGILEDVGFAVERTRLDTMFEASWERYVESWKRNEQYLAARAAEEILEELGFAVPADVRTALIDAFANAGNEVELHLTDGIEDCLQELKAAGIKLGIICDVGITPSPVLREHLIKRGLLPLFDHWSFSDEVGAYKPSELIFRHALDGLGGPAPERVAHVGDLRRTDIAGALAMGMTAVRYTGVFDDDSQPEPEGDVVVADHRELAEALGVVV